MKQILLMLPHSREGNLYQAFLEDDAKKAAATEGARLIVQYGVGENSLQWESITRAIAEDQTQAIICMPVDDLAIRPKVLAASKAGILFGFLNRFPDYLKEVRGQFPELPPYIVVPDQLEVGRIQARQVRRVLREDSRFLYVIDGAGRNWASQQRLIGMREEGKFSDSVMTTIPGAWRADKAYQALMDWAEMVMQNWIRLGRDSYKTALPQLIVLQSEGMYLGVRRGMDEIAEKYSCPQFAHISVMGCDGTSEFREMVDQGKLLSTVILPPTSGEALRTAVQWHRDKVLPPSEIVLVPKPYPSTSV